MSMLMASASSSSTSSPVTLTVLVSPAQASAIINGGGTAHTNFVTTSSSNGTGPYTAVWAYDNGADSDFVISNPTSVTTKFTNDLTLNQSKGAYYRVTMTDSLGNTGFTIISVTVIDISFEGGTPL